MKLQARLTSSTPHETRSGPRHHGKSEHGGHLTLALISPRGRQARDISGPTRQHPITGVPSEPSSRPSLPLPRSPRRFPPLHHSLHRHPTPPTQRRGVTNLGDIGATAATTEPHGQGSHSTTFVGSAPPRTPYPLQELRQWLNSYGGSGRGARSITSTGHASDAAQHSSTGSPRRSRASLSRPLQLFTSALRT